MRLLACLLILLPQENAKKEESPKRPGDSLGEKEPEKWKGAAYRFIEEKATAESLRESASKARVEMVLWEIRIRKDHAGVYPDYAWVRISEGPHTLPELVSDLEKQTSLPFDRQGFENYYGEEINLDSALERVPLFDALDRVIGTRIADFTSTRGRVRIWANSRMHSWRFCFGHTYVQMGSLDWRRSNRFAGKVEESVSTSLSFGADPRLQVSGIGAPVLLEAVDDTGITMEALPPVDGKPGGDLRFKPPGEKATKIARFFGYIPYKVAAKSEPLTFALPEPSKERTLDHHGLTLTLSGEFAGKTPKARLQAKAADAAAPATFPLAFRLVGKDGKKIDGTCDERSYQTHAASWDFAFSKLPDDFVSESVEVCWPLEQVDLRAWFEFVDLPLR